MWSQNPWLTCWYENADMDDLRLKLQDMDHIIDLISTVCDWKAMLRGYRYYYFADLRQLYVEPYITQCPPVNMGGSPFLTLPLAPDR